MANPATKKKGVLLEEVLADFEIPAALRRRAKDALIRLVDERIEQVTATARDAPRYAAASLGGGVERAVSEGQRLKRDILTGSEMLTPERAAARAGITRQALDLRRNKGQALALTHVKRGFRYPVWQFDEEVAEAVVQVLAATSHLDPWGQYFFLTESEPLLGGDTPLDALRAGNQDRVLKAVELLREEKKA